MNFSEFQVGNIVRYRKIANSSEKWVIREMSDEICVIENFYPNPQIISCPLIDVRPFDLRRVKLSSIGFNDLKQSNLITPDLRQALSSLFFGGHVDSSYDEYSVYEKDGYQFSFITVVLDQTEQRMGGWASLGLVTPRNQKPVRFTDLKDLQEKTYQFIAIHELQNFWKQETSEELIPDGSLIEMY